MYMGVPHVHHRGHEACKCVKNLPPERKEESCYARGSSTLGIVDHLKLHVEVMGPITNGQKSHEQTFNSRIQGLKPR